MGGDLQVVVATVAAEVKAAAETAAEEVKEVAETAAKTVLREVTENAPEALEKTKSYLCGCLDRLVRKITGRN